LYACLRSRKIRALQHGVAKVCASDVGFTKICPGQVLSLKGLPPQVGAAKVSFSGGVAA
jgi:hypothetical protein